MKKGAMLFLMLFMATFLYVEIAEAYPNRRAVNNGSYRRSCDNIRIRNGDTLVAVCRTRDGRWRKTRLVLGGGAMRDIANINGHLRAYYRRN